MKCCGKYFFLVCILSLGSFKTTSQVVYIELEPYVALQFDKEIRNPEFSSPTKGLSYIYGVNSYLNITDYFGLKGGLAIRKEPLYSNMVGQLAANITFAHFQERTISLSVEFGMEYNEYKDFRTPLYLGIDQYIARGVSCAYRIRLPSFYDTHKIKRSNYNVYGVEIGLKIAFPQVIKTKPIKGHGHPFILR